MYLFFETSKREEISSYFNPLSLYPRRNTQSNYTHWKIHIDLEYLDFDSCLVVVVVVVVVIVVVVVVVVIHGLNDAVTRRYLDAAVLASTRSKTRITAQ